MNTYLLIYLIGFVVATIIGVYELTKSNPYEADYGLLPFFSLGSWAFVLVYVYQLIKNNKFGL